MNTKFLTLSLIYLLAGFSTFSQNKTDDLIGIWLTPGDNSAKIEIFKTAEKYYGKIVWMKNPTINGKPKLDIKNLDKNKQHIPRLGLLIMKEFKFDGDDEWKGGNIYDPESGKTYSGYTYLKDKNTLKLRGYIGISLLGRTETWTRVD